MSSGRRFAYADPPYLGCGKAHYGVHHENAADYDDVQAHRDLIVRLMREFPDGWALSCHTPSLYEMLRACHEFQPMFAPDAKIRIAAWVKPFASFKPNVNPAYCWEPVIFASSLDGKRKDIPTVRDFCEANIEMLRGLPGVKPDAFCFWIFELLGAQPGDELHDLFPGSGAVGRAWEKWRRQGELFGRDWDRDEPCCEECGAPHPGHLSCGDAAAGCDGK